MKSGKYVYMPARQPWKFLVTSEAKRPVSNHTNRNVRHAEKERARERGLGEREDHGAHMSNDDYIQ